jgi:class 3 adenylate cyclase/tetratricopeptide (TPR) repeat protein
MTNPKITDVLASYVPRLIQKRVVLDSRPIDAPVAEQLQAVLLFADISGFTTLTESLAERGMTGVEAVAHLLNEYFGQLIEILDEYGGDVVKFAGDAIIAVWPIEQDQGVNRELQRLWTIQATQCALKIREMLHDYIVEDVNLRLKIAVSTGSMTYVHVGGVFNRWEFLITGRPLVELGIANGLAQAGDVLIGPSSWDLIKDQCKGTLIGFSLKDGIRNGARLESLNAQSGLMRTDPPPKIPEDAEAFLKSYIPGAIINRLSAGHSGWIAELRKVTVLFINLPDMDEDTSLDTAQEIARLVQRAVYRFEGSLNKINVDDKGITLVAALGLPPFSHENDPLRGVQAALMMRDELNQLGVRSSIGITTGRIFCGSIGNSQRREYTLIGNVVNLSARLMSLASTQTDLIEKVKIPILMDRPTSESVRDGIDFQTLPPQLVKGRSELIEIFHPISQKKSVIRPTTDLIGRQEEKALLANSLQELQRGTPMQVLILHGEAGIGKSRLTEDLFRQAETLGVKVLAGAGDSIEKNNPYHAWRSVFNKIFGIGEILSRQELLETDRRAILAQVTGKLREIDLDLEKYAPLLDVVLPTVIVDNEFTSTLTGEIRGGNIRELMVRLLQHEASQRPLLIALEDLHWLDSASWILLADVHQKIRPAVMVLNTRPLGQPVPQQFKEIAEQPETKFIKLDAMLLDEVEALVCQRLGVRSIPPEVGKLIREKSEGHPFFAEELAYALRDSGILVIEDQDCHISSELQNLESLTLPDNLQAAIISRIDTLNPSQQLALKVASVIGRIFSYRMLEAIYPVDTDRPTLPSYMNTLTRLSLTLIESESPDLAYIFKHAITQEVAYNLMLYSQRRQLHQSVAEWIERANEKDAASYYPLLAYHWMQAAEISDAIHQVDVVGKAVEYLEKAGIQASENNSNQEAIQFLTQALEWEAKLPTAQDKEAARTRKIRKAQWHGRIGLAHYGLGSLPDCEVHVREALQLLGNPLPKNTTQFVFGLFPQLFLQLLHWNFPSRFIGVTSNDRDRVAAIEMARLYDLMGRIYFYSNQTIPILYTGFRAMNSAERAGPSPELASAYSSMSVLMGFVQLHNLADTYVSRAVAISKGFNQPSNLITVGVVTSAYKVTVGKWDEVRVRLEEAKRICEQLGDYRQWGDCTAILGESALLAGDIAYAMDIQKLLLENARRRRSPLHLCWSLLGVGANHVRLGNPGEATPLLEEALQILEETPNLASSIETTGQLALAYLRLGQDEKALDYAGKVLDLSANISPTVYSMDIGFTAITEVYFELWEKALRTQSRQLDPDRLGGSAEKAIKLLHSFEKVFPIGQPHTPYYQGWYSRIMGKTQQAIKLWRKSLEAAGKFNMPYEEGLACYRLGSCLPKHDPSRKEYLNRALVIFENMGSLHELNAVREIL